MTKKEKSIPTENPLLGDVRVFIEQSRQQVAVTVNSTMNVLYWQI